MLEAIALTILIGSSLGILIMLFRKVPVLAELPASKTKARPLLLSIKKGLKALHPLNYFCPEKFLQKILLKTEKKANLWLGKLKQRAEQKHRSSDDYWKKLKISAGDSGLSVEKNRSIKEKARRKPKTRSKTKTKKASSGKNKIRSSRARVAQR